jgi:hypothetical protein
MICMNMILLTLPYLLVDDLSLPFVLIWHNGCNVGFLSLTRGCEIRICFIYFLFNFFLTFFSLFPICSRICVCDNVYTESPSFILASPNTIFPWPS